MHVPKYLLSDVVLSVCHLINRIPPCSWWSSSIFLSLSYQKKFHRSSYFWLYMFYSRLSLSLDKLSPWSIKYVSVGYSQTQKGYRCYSPHNRKYFLFADVTFFESVSFFSLHQSLFFFHHALFCLLLLFLRPLRQYHQRTLQSHLHHNLLRISDMSTLIDKSSYHWTSYGRFFLFSGRSTSSTISISFWPWFSYCHPQR